MLEETSKTNISVDYLRKSRLPKQLSKIKHKPFLVSKEMNGEVSILNKLPLKIDTKNDII